MLKLANPMVRVALMGLLSGSTLMALAATIAFAQQTTGASGSGASGKPPYNIVFLVVDQRSYQLLAGSDYSLPALDAIARHGVTFKNHYISSAMCSPSRASFLTGQPPQVTGVIDQMEYSFQPSLSPDLPNVGSVLKGLGYKTAYFGKFEMDKKVLQDKSTINYSTALKPYGFDVFSVGGDTNSGPDSGFDNDTFIAGEAVRWLRVNASETRRTGRPFFMVASFLNPHDIMFGNGNVPSEPPVQKPIVPEAAPPPPANSIYEKKWSFTLPASVQESLTAPGMPRALLEYRKGWDAWSGVIPTDRKDMWSIFYNYYLNTIQDNDRSLQQIVDTLNEMNLWRDTVVVFTADHGEMGGAHGGLKGKGPFAYEENAHVPLLIAHPAGKAGATSSAITSHLDLLPTFVGLTGLPDAKRPQAVKALPGRDFSALLADPEKASLTAVRPAALFNYVGPSTVDGDYLGSVMSSLFYHKPSPPLSEANLDKRGFLSFVFDGRYKFARYYAPTAFNTPRTLEEILANNDVQLFDLQSDPEETRNLALDPEKNRDTILRMNGLLNDLIAKEVGVNDGRFLAQIISVGTASAQAQRGGAGAATLSPEQRAIVRDVVRDELQDRLGNRITDRLSQLSPAQREALRRALKQRLAAEVREGLSDRIADKLGAGSSGVMSERVWGEIRDHLADRLAQLTPEQRAFFRTVMREEIAEELRETFADRIADGLSQLTPEQRGVLRTALRERLAAEVREGWADRLANQILDGHGD